MGAAQAGIGAMGAFGAQGQEDAQWQAQVATTNANNYAATSQYYRNVQLKRSKWNRDVSDYNVRKRDHEVQKQWNAASAARAHNSINRELQDAFKTAAFQDQQGMTELLATQGNISATGRSGKSIDNLQGRVVAQFGMNQAVQAQQLSDATYQAGHNMTDVWYQQHQADIASWMSVRTPPEYGMDVAPPTMQQAPSGPSRMTLMTGLGSAGLSGFQTFQQNVPNMQNVNRLTG
jgi:hypothetical protein